MRVQKTATQTNVYEAVAMRPGNALDEAMKAQSPQLVSHAPPSEPLRILAEQSREVVAQIAIGEARGSRSKTSKAFQSGCTVASAKRKAEARCSLTMRG